MEFGTPCFPLILMYTLDSVFCGCRYRKTALTSCLSNIKGRFQIRTVDNLNALRLRVKLRDKVLRNSRSVPVLIQNNFHRNAVVIFFLNVLFKLIGTCVFDTLTNTPVRMKVINSADRL